MWRRRGRVGSGIGGGDVVESGEGRRSWEGMRRRRARVGGGGGGGEVVTAEGEGRGGFGEGMQRRRVRETVCGS